jgi:hypothetical protein
MKDVVRKIKNILVLNNVKLEQYEIAFCNHKLKSYQGLLEYLLFVKRYKIPKTIFCSNLIMNSLINSDIYSFFIDIAEFCKYDDIFKQEVEKCNNILKKFEFLTTLGLNLKY